MFQNTEVGRSMEPTAEANYGMAPTGRARLRRPGTDSVRTRSGRSRAAGSAQGQQTTCVCVSYVDEGVESAVELQRLLDPHLPIHSSLVPAACAPQAVHTAWPGFRSICFVAAGKGRVAVCAGGQGSTRHLEMTA